MESISPGAVGRAGKEWERWQGLPRSSVVSGYSGCLEVAPLNPPALRSCVDRGKRRVVVIQIKTKNQREAAKSRSIQYSGRLPLYTVVMVLYRQHNMEHMAY